MSSLLLPHSRTRQPGHFVGGDIAQAQRFKTIWLATFNSNKTIRDVVRGHGLTHPGGLVVSGEGTVGTFNGAQAQNAALALPSGNPDTFVIAARIRATAAQAEIPGAAFGIYEGAAQGGVAVGFNSSNQIGAAWLSSAGAGIGAYSAAALNTWYTVFVQVAKNDINQYLTKAWVNGAPATTNQGSNVGSGSTGTMNEICIGAQHRSSGYLRGFKGDILWASLLHYNGPENVANFSFTDADALRLYQSGYPWQIFRPAQRKIWVPVSGSGSSVSGTPIVFEWAQTSSTFKESVNANPNAWAWETTPASMITKLQCSPVASEWAVTTGSIQDSAATSVTGNPVSLEWAQTSATFRTTLQASPIASHWETTQSEISESINATPAAWEWNTTTGSLLGTTSVDANPIAWAWEQTQATILQKSAEEETHETIGGKPDKKVKLPFYDSQKPYISHVEIEQPVFTEKTVNQPGNYFDVAWPAVKEQQEQAMLSGAMTPLGALAASEIAVQLPDEKIIYLDSAIEESVIVSLLLAA